MVPDLGHLRQLLLLRHVRALLRPQRGPLLSSLYSGKYLSPHPEVIPASDETNPEVPSGIISSKVFQRLISLKPPFYQ